MNFPDFFLPFITFFSSSFLLLLLFLFTLPFYHILTCSVFVLFLHFSCLIRHFICLTLFSYLLGG